MSTRPAAIAGAAMAALIAVGTVGAQPVAAAATSDRAPVAEVAAARHRLSAEDRVEQASLQFQRVFASNRGDALRRFYTRDATLTLPGQETVQGRKAIGDAWTGAFVEGGLRRVELDIESIAPTGQPNRFLEKGTYNLEIETPDGRITVSSTYEVLWRVPANGNRPRIVDDTINP